MMTFAFGFAAGFVACAVLLIAAAFWRLRSKPTHAANSVQHCAESALAVKNGQTAATT